MMRRKIIGRFKRSKQGGWEGEISTLAIQRQIRLVPNDDRVSDRAPSFRVMLGWGLTMAVTAPVLTWLVFILPSAN